MKKKVYIVRLGFLRVTPTALVEKSRNSAAKMKVDTKYATLTALITEVGDAADTLDAANQQVLFNGGKIEREAQRMAYAALKELYRVLGSNVQAITNGDKEEILAAGFDVVRTATPIGQLPAPGDVRVRVSPYPGCLDIRWDAVYGHKSYEVYASFGDPHVEASWKLLTVTSKNFHTAEGLTSGQVYHFRIVAIGAAGPSPASDWANGKAA